MELRENTQNSKPFLQQPTCVTWIAGGLLTAVKQNVLEENLKNKVLLRSAKQLVDHRTFPSPLKLRMDIPKYPIFWREIPSLKTYIYSFAPENRPGPKKEIHLPTTHIQVLNKIVSGRVSFDFFLGSMDWWSIFQVSRNPTNMFRGSIWVLKTNMPVLSVHPWWWCLSLWSLRCSPSILEGQNWWLEY